MPRTPGRIVFSEASARNFPRSLTPRSNAIGEAWKSHFYWTKVGDPDWGDTRIDVFLECALLVRSAAQALLVVDPANSKALDALIDVGVLEAKGSTELFDLQLEFLFVTEATAWKSLIAAHNSRKDSFISDQLTAVHTQCTKLVKETLWDGRLEEWSDRVRTTCCSSYENNPDLEAMLAGQPYEGCAPQEEDTGGDEK